MLLSTALSALSLAATATPTAAPPCAPLPGIDPLLDKPGLTYLLLGEYHGTVEMPAVAADVICHAAKRGRPLVVAVELPAGDQPALDRYMASDGGAAARKALLASPGWKAEGGRTTAAIADLIEAARRIGRKRPANLPVTLVAFDRGPQPGTSPMREAAMAKALESAAGRRPGSLVIAFTGAGHADKEGFVSRNPPFPAAAGHLPKDRTVSLTFARPGGLYWGCSAPDGSSPRGCAAYEMPAREPAAPRAIVLDPALRSGFDGLYHPGAPYTASRPALSALPR